MSRTRRIEIYVLDMSFNAPLDTNPNQHIELKKGDRIVTIDDKVYIPDTDTSKRAGAMEEDNHSLALFKTVFVEMNNKIFKKI